jgi:hypothetical protein
MNLALISLLEEIKILSVESTEVSFSHIYMEGNLSIDALSKEDTQMEVGTWFIIEDKEGDWEQSRAIIIFLSMTLLHR